LHRQAVTVHARSQLSKGDVSLEMTNYRGGITPRGDGGRSRRITDENLFRYLIDFEVQKALRLQYCVSVVQLGADVATGDANRLSQPHVFDALLRTTRATDVVTALPESSFGVLFIDADTTALNAIVRRLRSELGAVTGAPAPGQRGLTWSAGAACYPKTAISPADLIRQARDLMTRARDEGGDRFYIAS
jgi:hypothetical protein